MASFTSTAAALRLRRPLLIFILVACLALWFLPVPWTSSSPLSSKPPSSPPPATQDGGDAIKDTTPPPSKTTSTTPSVSTSIAAEPTESVEVCKSLPGADDVMVVLKTGATELYQKLPMHFVTLFRCTPHFIILSDLDQTIGEFHVHDILANVSDQIKDTHDDFRHYREIHKLAADNLDPATLKGDKSWNLDKWKFTPMLVKAYETRPQAKWFLLVEADTVIVWTNVLQWVATLDPNEYIYAGSQNVMGDILFAHGGSGVLISNAAMKKFAEAAPDSKSAWEAETDKYCCGDVQIGKILNELGVKLNAAFPILQGETPSTVDWNDRHMCAPTVAWHHVTASEVDAVWHMQQQWTDKHGWNTPYLFRDMYKDFAHTYVQQSREEWDNISENWKYAKADGEKWNQYTEVQKKSVESFENCRAACEDNKECLQFKYQKEECILGKDIRVGKSKTGFQSGWMKGRIAQFVEQFENCKPSFRFNQ